MLRLSDILSNLFSSMRYLDIILVCTPNWCLFFPIKACSVFVQAYAELLEEENISLPAWFCFNSKDGINVVSGDSFLECASIAESCKKVVAVGINCTPPRFIHGLITTIAKV